MNNLYSKISLSLAFSFSAVLLGACLEGGGSTATSTDNAAPNPPPSSGNSAPVISGVPSSIALVGSLWTFTPSASDADGDRLTFSITNMPDWATFSTSTGTLSGTPSLADVRDYNNIQISVTDSVLSASLGSYTVSVTQSAAGTATLSWSAPALNADGSTLADLAGFIIYYGTEPGRYSNMIDIDNPGISTYVVENLPPNTYFFSSKAYNSGLVESDFSNEASKIVQ